MKNFFNKFKNYGFWVSLSSAVVLLINSLGRIFGFSVENKLVEDLILSFAGVLLVLGLVTMNADSHTDDKDDDNQNDDQNHE